MLDQAMDALAEEIVRWAVKNNTGYGTFIGFHE